MNTILSVKKSIDWYNSNYKNATIPQLMDLKSKLVTENYYIAELVADNNQFAMQWENEKKIVFAKEKQKLIADGWQIGKAESKAESLIEESRNAHSEYKAVYDRLKILHSQINDICQDIQQRISVLKIEKQTTIQ